MTKLRLRGTLFLYLVTLAGAPALGLGAETKPNCLSSNPLGPNGDLHDLKNTASVLFVGTVLSTTPEAATFRVLRTFRGPERSAITVERNSLDGCSYAFTPGLTYLVSLINNIRGVPSAFTFAGTARLADAKDHVRWLDYQDKYWFVGPWLASYKIGKLSATISPEESPCAKSALGSEERQELATCLACEKRASLSNSNLAPEFRRRKMECDQCLPSLAFPINPAEGFSPRALDACPICTGLDFIYQGESRPVALSPACEACRDHSTAQSLLAKQKLAEAACGEKRGECQFVSDPKARADCDTNQRQTLSRELGLPWLGR